MVFEVLWVQLSCALVVLGPPCIHDVPGSNPGDGPKKKLKKNPRFGGLEPHVDKIQPHVDKIQASIWRPAVNLLE